MAKRKVMMEIERECCDFCNKPTYTNQSLYCPICNKEVCYECWTMINVPDYSPLYLCPDCKEMDMTGFNTVCREIDGHHKEIKRLHTKLNNLSKSMRKGK